MDYKCLFIGSLEGIISLPVAGQISALSSSWCAWHQIINHWYSNRTLLLRYHNYPPVNPWRLLSGLNCHRCTESMFNMIFAGLQLPPGMGLPPGLAPPGHPGHPSYPYDPLALAAQQQHDIYVREAALRQGLDMQRWLSTNITFLTIFISCWLFRMVESQLYLYLYHR